MQTQWISPLSFDGTSWKRLLQHGNRQISIVWDGTRPKVDDPAIYAAQAAAGRTWFKDGEY